MRHLGVLSLPFVPPSIGYRAYWDTVNGTPFLRWFADWFSKTYPHIELAVLAWDDSALLRDKAPILKHLRVVTTSHATDVRAFAAAAGVESDIARELHMQLTYPGRTSFDSRARNVMSHLALLVAVVLVPLVPASAVIHDHGRGVRQERRAEMPASQSKDETPEQKRRWQILDSVRAITTRIAALPEDAGKGYQNVNLMASLAGRLCAYDRQEGRRLFLEAAALFRRQSPPRTWSADSSQKVPASTWSSVVRLAGSCDAALGAQFEKESAEVMEPAQQALQQTRSLMDSAAKASRSEPQRAAELVAQSLKGVDLTTWQEPPGATGYVGQLVRLLGLLRATNQKQADGLFLDAVSRVRSMPWINASNLMLLGTYLFCSGLFCDVGGAPSRDGLIYDLSPERPDLPPELARAYLEAAINLLALAKPTEAEKPAALSAAIQLLPKAQKFAPDRTPVLEAATAALRPASPAAAADAVTRTQRSAEEEKIVAMPPEEMERRAESETDAGQRDELYHRLVNLLCEQDEFVQARARLGKLTDTSRRGALARLIDVREATNALGADREQRAQEIIAAMPASVERAVLLLARAAVRAKSDRQTGIALVLLALDNVDQIPGGGQPYVQAAAAAVLAKLDSKLALQVFQRAVADFNRQFAAQGQRADPGAQDVSHGWRVFYTVGTPPNSRTLYMTYSVAGKDFNITPRLETVIAALAEANPVEVQEIVSTLMDDTQSRVALPALVTSLLKQLPPPAAKAPPQKAAPK